MAPDALLEELLRVARAIGLEVRTMPLRGAQGSAGGLCTLKGRPVVILNAQVSAIEKCTVLADALSGRTLDEIEMPPLVRGFIRARERTRSRILLPRKRPGPGLAACRVRGNR
ncbi:MAG: hypothetical protein DIU78_003195 [Pseudomonadota bacterium]|nr:MAG: hypothetical protein DIU78_06570 [Pseudomonadota bacterium]